MGTFFNNKIFLDPVWYGLTTDKILTLSDKEVEDLKLKQNEIDEKNKEIQKKVNEDIATIKSLTKKYFGEHSKEYKYVSKFSKHNSYYSNDFNRVIVERRENAKKELEKQNREKEAKIAQDKYLTDAISYLISKGKKIGDDFTTENAVDVANEVAYEEEVEKNKELGRCGHLFEFSGSDYCENCGGWDGNSHRCECGNRRVCWTNYDFDFRKPYIYAEAY